MAYKSSEKQRKYQQEWYKRNRTAQLKRNRDRRNGLRKRVREWKVDCGCFRCGYNRSARALDIHHPNGDGKEGRDSCISALCTRGFAWSKILARLEKCEVVCANCHREIHDDTLIDGRW